MARFASYSFPLLPCSAWQLFAKHGDKEHDLIDCISFSMMEKFRIREAFGFGRHFTQHGFDLLPG
jgi:predicted nucleic acid-binding protein